MDLMAHAYLERLVGAKYNNLPVAHVPIGPSSYLDQVEKRHLGFWNNMVRGVDELERQFVSFSAACYIDGTVHDRGIFTVFRRYSDDLMFVLCRSHSHEARPSHYSRILEPTIGANSRVTEEAFLKLQRLLTDGEYAEDDTVIKLSSIGLSEIMWEYIPN